MLPETHVYEARYGWNGQSLRIIAIGVVFCVAVIVISIPLWFRIVALLFFGGGALAFAATSLMRRTAVRVDSTGISLCASPLYPRSATRFYPWDDVTKVVIWRAVQPRMSRLEYVGVERRSGSPPLTGRFVGRTAQSASGLIAPGVPPAVAVTGAPTNGWVLDRARLAEAVAHFGHSVGVLDNTTGQYLAPPRP